MKRGGKYGVREMRRGFTLPEVALAVGIIAFGLVAIFSVLPFGLSAQKDNREETVIRYEAEFWFGVLQAGGLPVDSLERVESVELTDNTGGVTVINRNDLVPPNATNPAHVALAERARAGWAKDVCGWLSAPDYVWGPAAGSGKQPRVPSKFARVWAVNGSLFDRIYSHRSKGGHYLDGGQFAFSYFLQTNIEPVAGQGTRVTLTFHWPVSEPIEEALAAGKSMAAVVADKELRPSNSKAFSILTNLRAQPMISNANLNARQFQFMRSTLPGDEVTIAQLQKKFAPRFSQFPWDGFPRQLTLAGDGTVIVQIYNSADGTWRGIGEDEVKLLRPRLGEAFHPVNDPGLYLFIEGYTTAYSIGRVSFNGHMLALIGAAFTPTPPNQLRDYIVRFLGPNETWESVLSDYQQQGLVEKRDEKYVINNMHNSSINELINITAAPFSITLDPADYWPAAAPAGGTQCSFWKLQ